MELFYTLLILLVIARILAELSVRIGQTALVGEIVAGIVIGVSIHPGTEFLPGLEGLEHNEVFVALADLGVFFLMLSAGLELAPRQLAKASRGAIAVAAGGMVLPMTLGCTLGWLMLPESPSRAAQILFIGVVLSVTAVPIAVKVLMDMRRVDTRLGQTIVSAAVIDDILSLLLLAVLTGMIRTGSVPDLYHLLILAAKVAGFLLIVWSSWWISGTWLKTFLDRLKYREEGFTNTILLALALAVLAEALGLHFILGAFAAGLLVTRRIVGTERHEAVSKRIDSVATGFLGPIFFVSIGIHLDLSAVTAVPVFLALLVAIAFIGKLLGAGAPALRLGMSRREALGVGVAMNARGAVGLIVADIALRAGLFGGAAADHPIVANLFSAAVIVAILTTLATPLLLRRVLVASKDA